MKYTATHKVYERGEFRYLLDRSKAMVLNKDGSVYTGMSRTWVESVFAGESRSYRFEEINICLENK